MTRLSFFTMAHNLFSYRADSLYTAIPFMPGYTRQTWQRALNLADSAAQRCLVALMRARREAI